jgi:hypothetical protein
MLIYFLLQINLLSTIFLYTLLLQVIPLHDHLLLSCVGLWFISIFYVEFKIRGMFLLLSHISIYYDTNSLRELENNHNLFN